LKGAALIFGLLAAVLGAGAIAVGNLESGLAANAVFAGQSGFLPTIVVYLIPIIGLLGAGLALAWPRVGSILLLLSAAGWLAAALVAGHGAVLFAALPFTFAAAGALVALAARERHPQAGDWDDEEPEDEDEDLPAYAPAPRGLRGRSEPEFDRAAPRRAAPVPPPRYVEEEPEEDEPPDEEDYVDAEEAVDEAAPDEAEDEAYADDEPYADEDDAPYVEEEPLYDEEEPPYAEDEPAEDEAAPAPAPPQRGGARARQGQWSLPDPEQSPAPQRTQRRHIPEEHRPPSRREPVAPPPTRRAEAPRSRQPAPEEFEVPDEDFAPARHDFEPRPRNAYREFDPYDPRETGPRRRGPLGGLLRVLVVLVFLLVVGGIAGAVYLYERGGTSNLFGSRQPAAATTAPAAASIPQPAAPAPAPASTALPAPAPATPASAVAEAAAPAATPSLATDSAPAVATPDQTAAPADTAAASAPPTYTDLFAYCRAVDTTDTPDSMYTGPAVPAAVLKTLGLSAPTDQAHWRCANQDVLACNSSRGAACDLTPTVDMMLSYCAGHPDAKKIPAPNGSWDCNGKRPVIPRDQKWPVDARGFYPGAWKRVLPAG
jgi:hypothetical protein